MYLIRAIFHNLIQFRAMESCMDVFARSKFKLAGMKEAMKEKYLKKMLAAGEKNHKQKWSFNGFQFRYRFVHAVENEYENIFVPPPK